MYGATGFDQERCGEMGELHHLAIIPPRSNEDVFKVDLTISFPVQILPLIAHTLEISSFFPCLICATESSTIELPDGITI
ncbi:hypothetical protein C0J52_09871 [Blattella germanica]|nr:hypothetical protein C0J52_09871 [Blattella germanica]